MCLVIGGRNIKVGMMEIIFYYTLIIVLNNGVIVWNNGVIWVVISFLTSNPFSPSFSPFWGD